MRIHPLAVAAIAVLTILPSYDNNGFALAEEKKKKKKKDIKKGTPDEPAYRIENYQENVPPPDDLQKVMDEQAAAKKEAEEAELDALLDEMGLNDDEQDDSENTAAARKQKAEYARREKWKADKRDENMAKAVEAEEGEGQLLGSFKPDDGDGSFGFGGGVVEEDEEDPDAPVEDYREPIAENYSSSYVPLEEAESYQFEAEVNRMLDIVINSLYQNKDVFLRELISNASDALDKIRYLSLTDPSKMQEKSEMEIKVQYDRDEQTLTITDTGIGMTKQDLVANLGTVAKSGTSNFLKAMAEGSDAMNMIGQFGVGFYSVFLVADHVKVASKNPDDPVQHIWSASNGGSEFTVGEDPRGNTLGRGTEITIFLKGDALKYIDPFKLEKLVTHYSEFIVYPISVRTTATLKVKSAKSEDDADEDDEVSLDDESTEESTDEEDLEADEDEELEDVISHSWKRVNNNPAIWMRDKDEITDDEYQGFFRVVAKDPDDSKTATSWSHFKAEGNINFRSILYLPDEVPDQNKRLHMTDDEREAFGLKLYVRKVLISDHFHNLLPDYLSFIKGVVDSDDLPLNVNRETLQESKIIKVIRKKLTRKTLEMIRNLSKKEWPVVDEDGEEVEDDLTEHPYITWYKKFGVALKTGVLEDAPNQKRLLKLLRFKTTAGGDEWRSLEDIMDSFKDWQDEFYFIAGEKDDELRKSVFLQKFNKKGVEVIITSEPIDEYLFNNLSDFEGKRFKNISKEGVKFKDEDADTVKRRTKAYRKKFQPLTKFLKETYGDSVSRVGISERLEDYPAIVSTTDYAHSANMERIFRAQARQHGQDPSQFAAIKVLEINPRHPYVTKLLRLVEESDEDEVDQTVLDTAWLLHDAALLNSGFTIVDTEAYSERMMRVIGSSLNVDGSELEDELEVPIEEEAPPEEDAGEGAVNIEEMIDLSDEF